MGENFDIKNIEIVNGHTLIQVDFRGETSAGRMFIPLHEVLMKLNNEIHRDWERTEIEFYKMTKEPKDAPTWGILAKDPAPKEKETPPSEEQS